MKLYTLLRRIWDCLPPQTWPQIFGIIALLLLAFLAAAFGDAWLKGTLP